MKHPRALKTGKPAQWVMASTSGRARPIVLTISKAVAAACFLIGEFCRYTSSVVSLPVLSPNFSTGTPSLSSSVTCRFASGVPFG